MDTIHDGTRNGDEGIIGDKVSRHMYRYRVQYSTVHTCLICEGQANILLTIR